MILTCFACNATGSIEAFTKDDAAGEFVNLAGSLPPSLWRALVAYIGLFRTSRKIPFERALKLAREVLALEADLTRLETALCDTVERLRQKGGKPLTKHNYLKIVLDNQPAGSAFTDPRSQTPGPRIPGKRAQALVSLREWAGDDWLRTGICQGLQALVAQSLRGQPAAEMIALNADIWHGVLKKILTIEQVDAPRLVKGFERLLSEAVEWPQPKQLVGMLPSRPHRQALTHELTEADIEAGKEGLRKLRETGKK